MAEKKESFFWTSYSDLMTSLFFVMLLLFIMSIVLAHNAVVELTKTIETIDSLLITSEEKLRKIEELQESVKKIDTTYFEYDSIFKRHTLRSISVSFKAGSSDINDISGKDRWRLFKAGEAITSFLKDVKKTIPNAEYLIIIEGQSSSDHYPYNNELSYARALALKRFWDKNGIKFDDLPCELLVSGSGRDSKFRIKPEGHIEYKNGKAYRWVPNAKNQRFVIHIIPKPGDFNFK